MGLTDLSMNPSALLEAKKTIRDMAFESWQSAARTILDFGSVERINRFIALQNDRVGLQSHDERTS